MAGGDLDLTAKVALVTGGSRGIGAGIVAALGSRGAKCIVNYVADPDGRNQAEARQVANALAGAKVAQADVGDPAQVAQMADFVRAEFGGLDILVNNAGILRERSIRKMSPAEDWDQVLRVNLSGAFNCIRGLADLIRAQGRIVNLSSVSGNIGFFGHAGYAASKAGLAALTRVAAREMAKQQITVNAVAPGFVRTDMTRNMPADAVNKTLEQIPMARWGEVDDVAGVVLLLCSPLARYITGQVIHVNGGFYMG